MLIPEWKWEYLTVDFAVELPKTQLGHDAAWVIVDRLKKLAHFLPVKVSYNLNKLVELYVKEIMRLHGASLLIISERDPRFTSQFWPSL